MSANSERIFEVIEGLVRNTESVEDLVKLAHFYNYVSGALFAAALDGADQEPDQFLENLKSSLSRTVK